MFFQIQMTTNHKFLLVSPEEPIEYSSVYIGSLILDKIKKVERISIFDLYPYLTKRNKTFNYENTISALIFLYMNGIIDFNPPYIYNLALFNKI